MLFGFRGIRLLQVIVALAAAALGVGCAVILKVAADSGDVVPVLLAVLLGLAFLWLFGTTLRLPTSFVAVAEDRTRIRFGGFVDVVVPNTDIVGARLAHHSFLGGLGVRTNFRGLVVLTAASGPAVELEMRSPVRVWVIPRLLPVKARRLVLGVRSPEKLVERFERPGTRGSSPQATKPGRRRR